jgi:hypothetical protein
MCIRIMERLKHRIGAVIDLYKCEVNTERGHVFYNLIELQTRWISARVSV